MLVHRVARKERYVVAENEQLLSHGRRFAYWSTDAGSNGAPVLTA